MAPNVIVQRFFEGTNYLITEKQYHAPLPDVLSPWYCYTSDGGHSILALLEGKFDESSSDFLDEMCPCPVKSVLRNYRIYNGYPVVPLEYSDEEGLIIDPEDDEY